MGHGPSSRVRLGGFQTLPGRVRSVNEIVPNITGRNGSGQEVFEYYGSGHLGAFFIVNAANFPHTAGQGRNKGACFSAKGHVWGLIFPGIFMGHHPNSQVWLGGFQTLLGRVRSVPKVVLTITDRNGSGQEIFKYHGSGRITLTRPDSTRPA